LERSSATNFCFCSLSLSLPPLYVVDQDYVAVQAPTRQNQLFAIVGDCEIKDHSAGEIRNLPRSPALHWQAPEI
jgi:hypothetical protein